MPTDAGTQHANCKPTSTVEIVVVALSALVAVGVSVFFLAVIGARRSGSATRHQSSQAAALIQHYGTGAPRTATQIHTTPAVAPPSAAVSGNPSRSKEEK